MPSRIEVLAKTCFFPTLVFGLMTSSIYVFYFQFCEPLLDHSRTRTTGTIVTLGTASLWSISMCCYMQILRIPPGRPEKVINNTVNKGDHPSQLLSLCQENGTPRFCKICKSLKPERSHHCRVCNTCVLKMDHHCSWINGCVGYNNHKIFFLFLFYTMIYVVWLFYNCMCLVSGTINIRPYPSSIIKFIWTMYKAYFVTLGNIIWNIWQSAWTGSWIPLLTGTPTLNITIKFQIIVMLYLTFLFGVFLIGLTGIQLYFILHNRTTLEHIATHEQYIRLDITGSDITIPYDNNNFQAICLFPPEKQLYDIGLGKNWKTVMGDQWYLWFLPIQHSLSTGNDGYVFPYGDQAYRRIVQDASPSLPICK